MHPRVIIQPNETFGEWTIISEIEPVLYDSVPIRHFLCQCSCGTQASVALTNLRSGATTRCQACRFVKVGTVKTLAHAREIIADCAKMSRKQVAKRHGVSIHIVYNILNGRTWAEASKSSTN